MKTFVNKLKQIDKTKKIVVLFITISFVFIIGFGCYHSIVGSKINSEHEVVNNNIKNREETNSKETIDDSQNTYEKQDSHTTKTNDVTQEDNTSQTSKTNKNISENKKTNPVSKNSSQNDKSQYQEKNNSTSKENKNNSSQNNNKNETNQNVEENNNISVNVKVIGINEIMMNGNLKVEKGNTAFSVLKSCASNKGIKVLTSGFGSTIYVRGIGDLVEKEHGPLSGWMYKVNNVAPNKSAGSYKLSDGDNVVWYYVNYE